MTAAELVQLIGALGVLLFGGGGFVAWRKAKAEGQATLSSSEASFRTAILARLTELETDREQLLIDNAAMQVKIGVMSNQIDDVTFLILERDEARKERDRAIKLLEQAERKAEVERLQNTERIRQLEEQVADLSRQLAALTNHKDGVHDQAAA